MGAGRQVSANKSNLPNKQAARQWSHAHRLTVRTQRSSVRPPCACVTRLIAPTLWGVPHSSLLSSQHPTLPRSHHPRAPSPRAPSVGWQAKQVDTPSEPVAARNHPVANAAPDGGTLAVQTMAARPGAKRAGTVCQPPRARYNPHTGRSRSIRCTRILRRSGSVWRPSMSEPPLHATSPTTPRSGPPAPHPCARTRVTSSRAIWLRHAAQA